MKYQMIAVFRLPVVDIAIDWDFKCSIVSFLQVIIIIYLIEDVRKLDRVVLRLRRLSRERLQYLLTMM
jgi:uncharacterized membrane protein (UPF0182 family)